MRGQPLSPERLEGMLELVRFWPLEKINSHLLHIEKVIRAYQKVHEMYERAQKEWIPNEETYGPRPEGDYL